jgi:hypothetical protein
MNTEGASQIGKIHRRLGHLHADEFVLHRPAAVDRNFLLMLHVIVVNTIIGHHRQQRHAGIGCGPQGTRRVQHLAVPLQIDADLACAAVRQ